MTNDKSKFKNNNMPNQNCIWIGIGVDIKKDSSFEQEIIKIQNVISSKYKSVFYPEKHPHLNLFDLDIPAANLTAAIQKTETILKNQRSLTVAVKDINFFPFGLFFIELETNDALYDLHRKIINAVTPLKENCICKDYLEPHRNYTARQKELLTTYGNPHVLDQFKPHITLGFLKERRMNFKTIRDNLRGYIKTPQLKVEDIHIITENKLIQIFNL